MTKILLQILYYTFIKMLQVKRKPLEVMLSNQSIFWEEIQSYFRHLNSQQTLQQSTIQKLQAEKYPWNNIEQVQIIQQLRNLLLSHVQQSIHEIVGNQIVAISNELLNLRNELTDFSLSQKHKNQEFKGNVLTQLEQINKKIATTSIITQQKQIQSSKYSRNYQNNNESKSVLNQLSLIKSQVDKMKESYNKADTSQLETKIHMIEVEITDLKLEMKMKMEQLRQKNLKLQNEIIERTKDTGSKQIITSQVKACMKARSKVMNIELAELKNQLQKLKQAAEKGQLDIQNYISNQLKSIWMHNINLKRRIQKIQTEIDVTNASFIAD